MSGWTTPATWILREAGRPPSVIAGLGVGVGLFIGLSFRLSASKDPQSRIGRKVCRPKGRTEGASRPFCFLPTPVSPGSGSKGRVIALLRRTPLSPRMGLPRRTKTVGAKEILGQERRGGRRRGSPPPEIGAVPIAAALLVGRRHFCRRPLERRAFEGARPPLHY